MENYNLHRRAQSGWHPTSYSRKPTPDAPRERNYAAILAAAKRPPVGYYEDAPRGIQFGGGGKPNPHGANTRVPTAAPSASSDDLYEPMGTITVVGDRFVSLNHGDKKWRVPVTISKMSAEAILYEDGREMIYLYGFATDFRFCQWRILKRQPRKQVDGRVWKMDRNCAQGSVVSHWANIGGVSYWREDNGSWNRYAVEAGDRLGRASVLSELHGPEADAIIRECAKAMGLI